jgi:UDP-N-acetylmuramate--alanine ligase
VRVHLIGIGGIGISGLAKYLYFKGNSISGSDQKATKITKDLEKLGIEITVPHSRDAISSDIDFIIYSAIIKDSNPEIIRAKELSIKTFSRSEAIGKILEGKRVFSVCGAHGKSTTSAMLSSIIGESSIIGAYNKIYNSNVSYSDSENLVFEADESDGSFLNSNPYYSIVTNAEPEHMEFYNYDLDRFYSAYYKFLSIGKKRVINGEDEFLKDVNLDAIRLYPSKDIKNIEQTLVGDEPYTNFHLKNYGEFSVWGLGEHIALDASLAILTALDFGMKSSEIAENLRKYRGTEKRFDILQKSSDFVLIDDYGHHPTEIEATLKSAFEYAKMKNIDEVVAIWQPHKYSRTLDNMVHFQSCFEGVSKLVILPVWSAGEEKIDVNFERLFSRYSPIFSERVSVSEGVVKLSSGEKLRNGLVIGFGAGDITYQLRGAK